MTTPAPIEAPARREDRLALLDVLTAEHYGVTVARCARCDWVTARPRHSYAVSALIAHDELQHTTELDKRRRQQVINQRGRAAAALAASAGRVTA